MRSFGLGMVFAAVVILVSALIGLYVDYLIWLWHLPIASWAIFAPAVVAPLALTVGVLAAPSETTATNQEGSSNA